MSGQGASRRLLFRLTFESPYFGNSLLSSRAPPRARLRASATRYGGDPGPIVRPARLSTWIPALASLGRDDNRGIGVHANIRKEFLPSFQRAVLLSSVIRAVGAVMFRLCDWED